MHSFKWESQKTKYRTAEKSKTDTNADLKGLNENLSRQEEKFISSQKKIQMQKIASNAL